MTKSNSFVVCSTLFVFSLALRLLLINKGPYSIDCLNFIQLAEQFLKTRHLPYHVGFGYPLTIILTAGFIFLGNLFPVPETALAANFISVLFGSGCVVLLYLIVGRWFDKRAAFYSAFLFSLCPIFLANSLFNSGHAVSLFFLLLGLYLLQNHHQTAKITPLLLSAAAFGCAGATRLQEMVLFFIPLSYFFFYCDPLSPPSGASFRKKIPFYLLFGAVIFFTALSFHLPYLLYDRPRYFHQLSEFRSLSIILFDKIFFEKALFHNIMYLTQTLSILGMLITPVGLALLYKDRPQLFIFFMLWIFIPFLLLICLYTIHPRHQIFILPPFIVAQTYALVKLMNIRRFFHHAAFIIYVIIIILTFGHYFPLFYYRHQHPHAKDYALWLGQVTEPGAYIISTDYSAFISRYAKRIPYGRMLKDRYILKDNELLEYKALLVDHLDKGDHIYITDMGLYTYDFRKKFSNFMKDNFKLEYTGKAYYDDWHRGYLQTHIFENALYKIKKKNETY